MDNKKDIIKHIVEQLKQDSPRAYRNGAWEKFQQQYDTPSDAPLIKPWVRWITIAATVAAIGFGALYLVQSDRQLPVLAQQDIANVESNPPDNSEIKPSESLLAQLNETSESTISLSQERSENNNIFKGTQHTSNYIATWNSLKPITAVAYLEKRNNPTIQTLQAIQPSYSLTLDTHQYEVALTDNLQSNSNTLANQVIQPINKVEIDALNTASDKRLALSNKVNLSLFVSPFATNDKLNVGGGMAIAYKLSNKLSVRTGASFNTYEVGTLKNPMDPAQVETVMAGEGMAIQKTDMADVSLFANKMILPNINAVNGVVQTVEVPLEMQVNLNKSLYATAGASYSAIVNQSREAQYVEQVASPSESFSKAATLSTVTRTVKSAEQNVSTNGFSGFVNFSIGKKVKMNNKVGLAVEPYVKVPVGQFRRADMDYTNGGIRIMTNF